MSFVGKVLVVVNVGLTICIAMFAGGVFAVQSSWRDKYNKVKSDYDTLNASKLKADETLKKDIADLKKSLADAQSRANTFEGQLKVANGALEQEKANHAKTAAALNTANQKNTLLAADNNAKLKDIDTLRTGLKDLHTRFDQLTGKVTALEDEKYGLLRERARFVKQHNRLVEDYLAARKLLAEAKVEFDPERVRTARLKPTPAEGLVVGVLPGGRDKATLVEISIGKDDGVEEGQSLLVYRLAEKSKYLGKIEIVYVTADKAVGTLVDDPKNGPIKKGDNVSAKL